MILIKKVLLGSIFIIMMFGIVQVVSPNSDGVLAQTQSRLEEERIMAQLEREERWMPEIACLARNVYYEARGESRQGQLAVALVTLNRVENGLFPDSICGVVNERKRVAKKGVVCQFSWRCESHTNPKKLVSQKHQSYQVALDAIMHYTELTETLVPGSTLFFHAKHVRPHWRKYKLQIAKIDNHIFYTQKPGAKYR